MVLQELIKENTIGAGSGGGSINIFYDSLISCSWESVTAIGGVNNAARGGKGTITAGSIAAGTFVKE